MVGQAAAAAAVPSHAATVPAGAQKAARTRQTTASSGSQRRQRTEEAGTGAASNDLQHYTRARYFPPFPLLTGPRAQDKEQSRCKRAIRNHKPDAEAQEPGPRSSR
jgi:hypothetical protein